VITAPVILKPNFDKIPELLQNLPHWIVWKNVKPRPDGRYDKIPCDSRTANAANAHDPAIWLTFAEVKQAYETGNFAGIGIVLDGEAVATTDAGEPLYLVGIDIDHCASRNAVGKPQVSPEAAGDWELIGRPYWEYSPSETGLRMFGLSKELMRGQSKDGHEVYFDKRFLTITGACGNSPRPIKDFTDALVTVMSRWFVVAPPSKPVTNNSDYIITKYAPKPENDVEIARVKEMLSFISADCDYAVYRDLLWAIESTGWKCCEDIGRAWSMSCEPKFDEELFQQLRGSFVATGGITLGTLVHHAKLGGGQPEEENKEALAAVQKKFALMSLGGKVGIIDRHVLEARNSDGTAASLQVINRADGGLLIERFLFSEYPQSDAKKQVWTFMRDNQTTAYNGVAFSPEAVAPDVLNLWVGATIKPKSGKWTLIQEFLHDVLCGGRDSEYQYLIKYIAHALQRPWEKPGVMVVMLGGAGVGKGTLGRILKEIWHATFLQTNKISQIVGGFNGSLERAYVVFLDEALFAGDRASSDALKSLVTESTISINEKYQPARQITSYHRFFSATNADWFKSTDRDDRRDFVLRVSEQRKGDHAYWCALNAEIERGGVEALAHDLLALDLTDFNVRIKPNTRELTEQKLQSLEKFPRWWFDCLSRGAIDQFNQEWPDFVSTATLLTFFKESERTVRSYRQLIDRDVVVFMSKLCPSATRCQGMEGITRKRGYQLPTVETARADFEKYIGDIISWEEV